MATSAKSSIHAWTPTAVKIRQSVDPYATVIDSPADRDKRDLERYYFVLFKSLAEVQLNFVESVFILEMLKDIPIALVTVRFMSSLIDEELRDTSCFLGMEDWGLQDLLEYVGHIEEDAKEFAAVSDAPFAVEDFVFRLRSFREKVQSLTIAQSLALWDAAQRWDAMLRSCSNDDAEFFDTVDEVLCLGVWQPRGDLAFEFRQWSDALKRLNHDLGKRAIKSPSANR